MEGDRERNDRSGMRRRRHSPTAMNAWYNELGGRNKETSAGVGSVAAKVSRKVYGEEGDKR